MLSERAVVYAEKEGYRALRLDIHRPDSLSGPRPVVLQVHGGGWRVSARDRAPRETRSWEAGMFERLTDDHGFVVVACDYRFSSEALWPAAVDDVKDAVRWAQANIAGFGGDAARLALFGQSAGGYLAAAAGLATDLGGIAGVACWYPITDFTVLDQADPMSYPAQFLGRPLGTITERAVRASLPRQVHAAVPPFLLVHGTADTMAPYEQSVRLHDAFVNSGAHCSLDTVDGADHFFVGREDAVDGVWARTVSFLQEVTA